MCSSLMYSAWQGLAAEAKSICSRLTIRNSGGAHTTVDGTNSALSPCARRQATVASTAVRISSSVIVPSARIPAWYAESSEDGFQPPNGASDRYVESSADGFHPPKGASDWRVDASAKVAAPNTVALTAATPTTR